MTDHNARLGFDGEVALITGAGSGVGLAYAKALARRGCHVVINDIADRAEDAAGAIRGQGGIATAAPGSVATEAQRIVARAVDAGGRLDIVINNAGISGGGPFHRIDTEAWNNLIDVHLGGTVAISREAWPLLEASRGRLVNTSSASLFGAGYTSSYVAAKGAIFGLTRCWAQEGVAAGIRVNCIMPSAATPMTAQIPDDAFRNLLTDHFPPEPVAEFVAWLVHRETAITGETFHAGGGRVGRILLCEQEGLGSREFEAENWSAREDDLLTTGKPRYPMSMMEQVGVQAELLGGDVLAAFRRIGGAPG